MKLTIDAFRGTTKPFEITFKPRSDLTILYGENGSGKTTISDALEFLMNENPGSLKEKSLDGMNKTTALVNASRSATDLKVEWTEGSDSLSVQLSGARPNIVGNLPSTKLRTFRRDLITKLIEETPSLRFKRIQDFVSVPNLEAEEESLKEFIKSHKGQLQSAEKTVARTLQGIEELYEEAQTLNSELPELRAWVKATINATEENQAKALEACQNTKTAIDAFRQSVKPLKEAFEQQTNADKLVVSERKKLETLTRASAKSLAAALPTLQAAQVFLSQNNPSDACPVCDTKFEQGVLAKKVSEKLKPLQSIATQQARITKVEEDLSKALTLLATRKEHLFEAMSSCKETFGMLVDMTSITVSETPSILSEVTAIDEVTAEWFENFLMRAATELKPVVEIVDNQVEALMKARGFQKPLVKLVEERNDAEKEYKDLSLLIQKADTIRGVFHDARIQYANDTLASISAEFARLYESVHSDEDISTIKMYLHPTKQGSAHMSGQLFGKDDASPVAYLSESHLDTLGLCLFLALERQEAPSETIIVLDDAIASVDEAHMERLYEMILAEASSFKHVIITSHYQPLRFKFRWGQLTRANVDLVELGRWSLEDGINFRRGCDSEINLLRLRLQERDDPTSIAALSGKVLEYVMDFLTGIYRCKLPRHPGAEQRWTLGDYKSGLEGNKKKLLKALRCEHLEDDRVVEEILLQPLLEAVFQRLELRNALGAHYKEIAGYFDELSEAMALGKATLALVDAVCDESAQLPDKDKNGSCWSNRGVKVTRRLHPLIQPT